MKQKKIIFITGGIVSGIGKGVTSAAIGLLLKSRGFSVLPIKIDPYLNKDAGTMNPFQHGEVFVTEDGGETDLDLGHYERFLGVNVDVALNFTTGVIYDHVIHQERRGDFLGKTIQIIPHVTDEIKRRIELVLRRRNVDVVLVEIGGTVGDIEAEPFIEAARQMHRSRGNDHVVFVHVVKIDYLFPSDEEKTKPIQQSAALVRERGIQPDVIVVRAKRPLGKEIREKISLFTNIDVTHVVEAVDAPFLYDIPLSLEEQGLGRALTARLGLNARSGDMRQWKRLTQRAHRATQEVVIGMVGKYVKHVDAYLSVEEAVRHAATAHGVKARIHYIDAEGKNLKKALEQVDGIIVPGGFGSRGIEGKIEAIRYAREHRVPYLGLCLGMQLAVVEFARHVCTLRRANSSEFDQKTPHPVVDLLLEQKNISHLGGTMRLGASPITLKRGSLACRIYGGVRTSERHRHRYEVNPRYHARLRKKGLVISGVSSRDPRLVEFIELPGHPFFVATQAHAEFKSRFIAPHPLFLSFVAMTKAEKEKRDTLPRR